MTWRGFIDNAERIEFTSLDAGMTFLYYLNEGYGQTKQRKNGIQWKYECKHVSGCPFCIILLPVSRKIPDGCKTVNSQLFQVTRCIGHNHSIHGDPVPVYGRRRVKGGKWVTIGSNPPVSPNSSSEDQVSDYSHRNGERLRQSEEWYNKSLNSLSICVSDLRKKWNDILKQRDIILSACTDLPHFHVDVVTEVRMEEGLIVMDGSKPTEHSEAELSRFIDLLTIAIHTPSPHRRVVCTPTIAIPPGFSSYNGNEADRSGDVGVADEDEADDHGVPRLPAGGERRCHGEGVQMEETQERPRTATAPTSVREMAEADAREMVMTTFLPMERERETEREGSANHQLVSSQRSLRSGTRRDYRLLNDPHSRESRAALAGGGGSGTERNG